MVSTCWGSVLNFIAHYLLDPHVPYARFTCPACKHHAAWYDNIPVISWIVLQGHCRHCQHHISILDPAIELLSGFVLAALTYTMPLMYLPAYYIFFSALIVSIRTDLETMLLSRLVTLFLVPLGIIFSFAYMLPISVTQSILGAIGGYLFLAIISHFFYLFTGKEGMGQGDVELLAFIGSFIGIQGAWASLFIGSLAGSIVGIIYMIATKAQKIPFGPFLAIGAISYVLLQPQLLSFYLTL